MAEEVLVREPLREDLRFVGRELTHLLARSSFQLEWAFWLYTSEVNDWRLVLVTPLVDSEGPKKVYARLREILRESQDNRFNLLQSRITVQGSQNLYAKAFADAGYDYDLKSANDEPRLFRQRLGNVFVEDALIYNFRQTQQWR